MDQENGAEDKPMENSFKHIYTDEIYGRLSEEFRHLNGTTYLDHAGSTLYSLSQMAKVHARLTANISLNPHTGDSDRLDRARKTVLDFLSADPEEYAVVFNSGATEGLKTVGEFFPWANHAQSTNACETGETVADKKSQLFIHKHSHTSAVGIREYARQHGAGVTVWVDEDLPTILEIVNSQSRSSTSAASDPAPSSYNLFCFPAMSNFDGRKIDLGWISRIQANRSNLVLLDTASFLATNTIDLSKCKPDFLVLSFYKLFGYPTGLGALVVKKSSAQRLNKTYFGGGTVDVHTVSESIHKPRPSLDEYLEDGTANFLGIQAIETGFETIKSTIGSFRLISEHTFNLANYTFNRLKSLKHYNGRPAIRIYSSTQYEDVERQGGIVNFNLLNSQGNHIGYSTFKRVAETENIVVRTGCFCNTGSCQDYLGLDDKVLMSNYENGHVCGDNNDLVDGKPTGSIRASFGYMSCREDAEHLVKIIEQYFLETQASEPNVLDAQNQIKVVGLYLYPVKSCRGIQVSSWQFNSQGLLYDRQWVIMEGRKVLTQKTDSLMAQIATTVSLDRDVLILSFPQMPDLEVPLKTDVSTTVDHELCIGNICGERMEGVDCGEDAADWLEEALGRPALRLVRGLKRFSGRSNPSSSLANDSEILTLNLNSIQSLLARIEKTCEQRQEDRPDLDVEGLTQRFRGNLVVDGELPFREEKWTNFRLQKDEHSSEAELKVVGACKRCTMIGIEQGSGEKTKEPLRSLATFRDRNFCFGVHTKVLDCGSGIISVGDKIEEIVYSG